VVATHGIAGGNIGWGACILQLPKEFLDAPQQLVPQLPMIVLGAMLLATCLLALRTLEE
jgi:hypothetical protein